MYVTQHEAEDRPLFQYITKYSVRYPNRRVPSHQTFGTTYRRLRETGTLRFHEPRVNARHPDVAIDEQILDEFNQNPTKSIRVVAAALGMSIWKVWSVLRDNRQHAFHCTPVQGMILQYILNLSV